jgi:hypothetical protein
MFIVFGISWLAVTPLNVSMVRIVGSVLLNRPSGVSSTYHFLREHLHLVVTQDIPNHHPCGPSADPGCHYVPPS